MDRNLVGRASSLSTLLLPALLLTSVGTALFIGELAARVLLHPGDYLRASLAGDSILGHVIEPNTSGHDAWGFRNRDVPSTTRVVTIGDSQTYGHSAPLTGSWPYQLQQLLGEPVYNVSLGGYGPLEYLHLVREKSSKLQPEVIVVGLYLGNDLKDAYDAAHLRPYWQEWTYSKRHQPRAAGPVVESELPLEGVRRILGQNSVLYGVLRFHLAGPIRFIRGENANSGAGRGKRFSWTDPANPEVRTIFTPKRRFRVLDQNDPTIEEGLLITKDALHAISTYARSNHWDLLVALIPTKEEAYCDYLRSVEDSLPQLFNELCDQERSVRVELMTFFGRNGIRYVDTSERLKEAVADHLPIYPPDWNGHPTAAGYRLIAEAVYAALEDSHSNRLSE